MAAGCECVFRVPTMRANTDTHSMYGSWLKIRAPAGFAQAVAAAARLNHQTSADFVRQLLLREMRKSGVRLGVDGRVETPNEIAGAT
jgi:hypothetical protein